MTRIQCSSHLLSLIKIKELHLTKRGALCKEAANTRIPHQLSGNYPQTPHILNSCRELCTYTTFPLTPKACSSCHVSQHQSLMHSPQGLKTGPRTSDNGTVASVPTPVARLRHHSLLLRGWHIGDAPPCAGRAHVLWSPILQLPVRLLDDRPHRKLHRDENKDYILYSVYKWGNLNEIFKFSEVTLHKYNIMLCVDLVPASVM